ncbi:MAG: hypothetical protein JSV04_10300 [Candidatus Heimdallarchaeota archaeon]|nr:MAG: hypothetical protein JSV04_10300 [Candidatus Heimdallarchaeota archaeon]
MKGRNQAILFVISLILISPCFVSRKTNTIGGIYRKPNPTLEVVQNQNPILYIPGWTKEATDWNYMKVRFQANRWPGASLCAIDFSNKQDSSVQGNINNANEIKQRVDEILEETGAEKIDLISHSMGGLSSRYYIKFLGGIEKVDDYVSLASPHHGEEAGEKCEACCTGNELLLSLNEGDETPGGILNDILGDRVAPWSGITYNGTHIPGNISYTSIYSLQDEDVPFESCPLDGANNIRVMGLSHSEIYQDWSVYKLVRTAVDDFNTTFLMTAPIIVSAISGDSQVTLVWQAPYDDGGAPIIEYKVYRADNTSGPYSFILNSITLNCVDYNVTNDVTYYYVVTAVNSVGESEYSNVATVTPHPPIFTTTTSTATPCWNSLFLFLSLLTLIFWRQQKGS